MSKRVRSRIGILIAALAGAVTASHVFARRAHADCQSPEWQVELQSVTASNNSTTHQGYWPTGAILLSSPGYVRLFTTHSVLGQVGTVEANQ
jgi:hypothetical protein